MKSCRLRPTPLGCGASTVKQEADERPSTTHQPTDRPITHPVISVLAVTAFFGNIIRGGGPVSTTEI